MKHIKSFESFINESKDLGEVVKKFSSFISVDNKIKSDNPINKLKIKNPETDKIIKLTSALKKDDSSKVKQLADIFYKEYQSGNGTNDEAASKLDKDIDNEIQKREKQYKEEYKEYGQDWTETDSHRLKNEVRLDFYGNEKNPVLKRKIEQDFLNDPKIDGQDYVKAADSFDDEGIDYAYDKLDKEKLNKILNTPDGSDYAKLILRSKNANPEQRQISLQNEWVRSSDSSASILMAEHLSKRLNMSKDVQKSINYRKENGTAYSDTKFGGLRNDVTKKNIEAIDNIYNKSQEYYKKKGIKEITVYRGTDDKDIKYKNAIESWTSDSTLAKEYGYYQHKKTIPVEQVLMGHFDDKFPDPYAMGVTDDKGNPKKSKEVVILGK